MKRMQETREWLYQFINNSKAKAFKFFKTVYKLVKRFFIFIKKKKHRIVLFSSLCISLLFFILLPLPDPLFSDGYSTVLKDKDGVLLGAYISDDEQWRFPPVTEVPEKIAKCMILYEDKNFYSHSGIDIFAAGRAIYQNISSGRFVSGASTITMQVMRLSRKNQPRNIPEKIIESLLALKLEMRYSKDEILALYASHAPFGGNIVGIEAACWRYFGRRPDNITWAEAAMLAVLPNNPALIHPGRNREKLFLKRNMLLERLFEKNILDVETYLLSIEEPLPGEPHEIPRLAPHLLVRAIKEGYRGDTIISTIDSGLQELVYNTVQKHYSAFSQSRVYNAAALVIELDTGNVLAYAGNTRSGTEDEHDNSVDIIMSDRSVGSIFKPFLYSFMLDEGLLLPDELIADIPILYQGFAPKNYGEMYDGVIPASTALSRSLNVPFVLLLNTYGYFKFYHRLEQLGMEFPYPPSHYSLALILGGAESSLWNIVSMYSKIARILKNSTANIPGISSDKSIILKNNYISSIDISDKNNSYFDNTMEKGTIDLSPSAVWFAFNAMREVVRPDEEMKWESYSSSEPIAWKTGTSYGNRDAWAIGITTKYIVGVWVGNADGEGRPEIKGAYAAGPLLFNIFKLLPESKWFEMPLFDMEPAPVCNKSGMLASRYCDDVTVKLIPKQCLYSEPCRYHKIVHLDKTEQYLVDSSVYPVEDMVHKKWFILPPVEEWYFQKNNSWYKPLPSYLDDTEEVMEFVYPDKNCKIYVPVEIDGSPGETVFEVIHRIPETVIYWHLDDQYTGSTKNIHQKGFFPEQGPHRLVVIDENGNEITRDFEILPRRQQ